MKQGSHTPTQLIGLPPLSSKISSHSSKKGKTQNGAVNLEP
jgi:hypothetical protein